MFLFVPCGGLSWLHVSFVLHFTYAVSYRIHYNIWSLLYVPSSGYKSFSRRILTTFRTCTSYSSVIILIWSALWPCLQQLSVTIADVNNNLRQFHRLYVVINLYIVELSWTYLRVPSCYQRAATVFGRDMWFCSPSVRARGLIRLWVRHAKGSDLLQNNDRNVPRRSLYRSVKSRKFRFSAVPPLPHMIRFISSTERSIPVQGRVCLLCFALRNEYIYFTSAVVMKFWKLLLSHRLIKLF